MKYNTKWFLIALAAGLIAAPNATIIRSIADATDPYYWNMVRFALIAIICLPWLIRSLPGVMTSRTTMRHVAIASLAMTVAVFAYVEAIYHSQASYVAIMTLVTPLVFMYLSTRLVGDKVTRRTVGGIALAAAGAMMLVLLPVALHGQGVGFYPFATAMSLVNSVTFALAVIYLRKANEAGISMIASVGYTAVFACVLSAVVYLLVGDTSRIPTDSSFWWAVGYSAIGIALVARALNVWAYERVGSSVISAIGYLETFVAILIPVIVLGERLSVEMVLGGTLILLGVYVVETKHRKHTHHHFVHRHH